MARPKKVEAAVNEAGGQLMSSADIIWMRDNVITGLSNLENGVHELRRTYITYFNSRLPEGHPARLNVPFFPAIYANDNNGVPRPRAETPGGLPGPDGGAKRKRKPHDPNAPKRALTSYFLFMRDNKPVIKDQNPDWTAAQISAESEKRWENISEQEKAEYDHMYQVDLARYYKQKECYEAGEPIPDISASEAVKLYDEQMKSGQPPKGRKVGKAPDPVAAVAPMVPVEDPETASATSDDEEDVSPEPAPPKVDRASKRHKTAKDDAAKPAGKVAKAKETPVAERVSKSPEMERKKKAVKKQQSVIDEEAEEEEVAAAESPKKEKKNKKKRKSEIA